MSVAFVERLKIGTDAQARLKILLAERYGYTVADTGQEQLLKDVHSLIRYQYNMTARFAKHFPDLFCVLCDTCEPFYLEVKATKPEYWDGPNFSIEHASLEICQALADAGMRIAIAFENRPGNFYADWAQCVEPHIEFCRKDAIHSRGSGTPFCLVRKDTIPTLDEFFEQKAG